MAIIGLYGFEGSPELGFEATEWNGNVDIAVGCGRFGGNAFRIMEMFTWEGDCAVLGLASPSNWYTDTVWPILAQGSISFALRIRWQDDPMPADLLAVISQDTSMPEFILSFDHRGLWLEDNQHTRVIDTGTPYQLDRWHWVQICWDVPNHKLALWFDGEKKGEITNAGWSLAPTPERLVIGNNYVRMTDGVIAETYMDDFVICDEYDDLPENGTRVARANCGGADVIEWQGYETGLPYQPAIWQELLETGGDFLYTQTNSRFVATNAPLDLDHSQILAIRFGLEMAGNAHGVVHRITVGGQSFDAPPLADFGGAPRFYSRTFGQSPVSSQPWSRADCASGNLGWGIQSLTGEPATEIWAYQAFIEYARGPEQVSGLLDARSIGHLVASGSTESTALGHNLASTLLRSRLWGHLVLTASGEAVTLGHSLAVGSLCGFFSPVSLPLSGCVGGLVMGYVPKPGGSCPLLDPTASIQIGQDLIEIYQSRIDALINQLGINIHLEFDPIVAPCDNCGFDAVKGRSTGVYKPGGPMPFSGGRKCPKCKGEGVTKTANTQCIKCLVKWNPQDYRQFGIAVGNEKALVRTKGLLADAPAIMRASTAVMNADIEDQIVLRVRRLRGPIPVGLREDRYAITFWELIDSE